MSVDDREQVVIDWPEEHDLSVEGRDRMVRLERDLVARVGAVRAGRRRRRAASVALLLFGVAFGSFLSIERDRGDEVPSVRMVEHDSGDRPDPRTESAGGEKNAPHRPDPRIRIVRASDEPGFTRTSIRTISDRELEDLLVETRTAAVLTCDHESADRSCSLSLIGSGRG